MATESGSSRDDDESRPWFSVGEQVRVVLNERNRTPRTGRIRDAVWHHKNGCWNYYLVEQGRKVKKRYLAEDLDPEGWYKPVAEKSE